ncbi:type II toxin-antitoxin system ParD family antitoxin [Nodosilinea sp. AN01ver1]|uniref:type II toxin-antitoxin system ParD family antitoxin n=1 Tax=Nodosilinea sp. AN01ver1 TaxID=3423362 RepID=UPI003D31DC33
MEITLKPEQERFVTAKLQQGKYESIDEILAIAFRLLEENEHREQALSELRSKIAAGTEQIRQGKVVDGEAVFQHLQEKLDQMPQEQ